MFNLDVLCPLKSVLIKPEIASEYNIHFEQQRKTKKKLKGTAQEFFTVHFSGLKQTQANFSGPKLILPDNDWTLTDYSISKWN